MGQVSVNEHSNAYEQWFVCLRLMACPTMHFFLLPSAYTIKLFNFLYSSLRLGSENNPFSYMMLMITVQQHSKFRVVRSEHCIAAGFLPL